MVISVSFAVSRSPYAQSRNVWLACVVGSGLATYVISRRFIRRWFVLPHLLRQEVVFPAKAPTRWAMARPSISRRAMRDLALDIWTVGTGPSIEQASHQIFSLDHALTWLQRRQLKPGQRLPVGRLQIVADAVAEELRVGFGDRTRIWWALLARDLADRVSAIAVDIQPTERARRRYPAEEVGCWLAAPMADWLGSCFTLVHGEAPLVSVGTVFLRRASEISLTADPARRLDVLRRDLQAGARMLGSGHIATALNDLDDDRLVNVLDAAVPGPISLRAGAASGVAAVFAAVLLATVIRIPGSPEQFGTERANANNTPEVVVTTTTTLPRPPGTVPLLTLPIGTTTTTAVTVDSRPTNTLSTMVVGAGFVGASLPGARNDSTSLNAGQTIIIDVRANDDKSVKNGVLSIVTDTLAVGDSAFVNNDATVSFTASDQAGTRSFAYELCIGPTQCSIASVRVDVTP